MILRYFAMVDYLGTNYAGWQNQLNAVSVQSKIESSLSTILGESIQIKGCGRTDAGVHARNYIFHFDTNFKSPQSKLYNINALLPHDIHIHTIMPVHIEAHARYDATYRKYTYVISGKKDVFHLCTQYHLPQFPKLNIDTMRRAAQAVLTTNNFEKFCKTGNDLNGKYQCNIIQSHWQQFDHHIEYQIAGNRFLRGMVRLLVGGMLQVGLDKCGIEDFISSLQNDNSQLHPLSAPAHGLTFEEVRYPYI